jgi:hypothetical protein
VRPLTDDAAVDRRNREAERYDAVTQYSLAKILGVWAAAAVPMAALAWIVAHWLRDQLGGRDPFAEALLICLTAGLVWQFVLVVILVRQELGGLAWPRVLDALTMTKRRRARSPGRTSTSSPTTTRA